MIAGLVLITRPGQAQEACQGATYEAENMFHSTGGSTPGGWNIWTNGYISTNHNFDGGTKVITVVTRGQSAVGVPAHMVVSVNGVDEYHYSISATNWTAYSFNVDVPAGTRQIRVSFDNDYNQSGQDRNLYVDKVIVGCGGGWTNLILRDGWVAAADSNPPAVGLVDGIVTFRGALNGEHATSNMPFCLTDGHVEPGPDYTQYRPADVGYLTTRAALANGATGSLLLGPVVQPPGYVPDQELVGSYCFQVSEDSASPDPGPNGALLTSLEGVSFTKSGYGVSQNAVNLTNLPGGENWAVDYPQRGTDSGLPGGEGWHAKLVNGFVRFQGESRYIGPDPFDPVLFKLPAGMIPSNPVYIPVVFSPFGDTLAGRIVVQTNGDVEVEGAIERAQLGVSLDGASFSVSQASGSAFPLSNGWTSYSSRLVRARLVNGVVRLEGAVKDGSTTVIGQLPASMAPSHPIYVVANAVLFAQQATLRINTDGTIEVVSPSLVVAQPGLSLDGVSFAPGPFQCTGGCLSATPLARNVNSGPFNTLGERWFVVTGPINGWQASETAGRTIRVNGVVVTPGQMPLPPAVNGTTYYFDFSAGSRSWASWSFW
jgi:hypothetical protein